jgi:hypothetical protein
MMFCVALVFWKTEQSHKRVILDLQAITHYDAGEMGVQNSPLLVVLPMYLQEMRPEVL